MVWSITTASIPAYYVGLSTLLISLLSVERALFFLAITIPFDIRDERIDQQINVKTLVHSLGNKTSIKLAITSLLFSFFILLYLYMSDDIRVHHLIGFGISYFITSILIYKSKAKTSDYYFTGILDGTMLLVFAILYLLSIALNVH